MIAGPLAPNGVLARSMPPTAERLAVTCERGAMWTIGPTNGYPAPGVHVMPRVWTGEHRHLPSLRGVRVLTRRDSRPLREVPVSLPFLTASVPPDAVGSLGQLPGNAR